jgi:ribosomal protein L40E
LSQIRQTDLQLALIECNGAPSAQVNQALIRTREFVRSQSSEFERSLAAESSENQQALTAEAAQMRKTFADYENILSSLNQKLSRWNALESASFLAQLESAISNLTAASLAYRDATMALRGPTTHAGLNEMWHLLGQLPDSLVQLGQFVELETAKTKVAQELWDSTAQNSPSQSSLHLLHKEFCQIYLDFLASERVQAAVSGREHGMALRALRSEMTLIGTVFARIDVATVTRRMSHKPTRLPFLNVVMNAAWMVESRALHPVVHGCVTEQALLTVSQQTAQNPSPELEELAKLLQRYQLWILQPEQSILASLHQRAEKIASQAESAFLPESATTQAPKLVCTICGLQNPPDSRKCRSCGGSVATQSQSMKGLEDLTAIDLSNSPRLEQLLLLAVQVMRGKANPAELVAHCDHLEGELEAAVQVCPDGTGFAQGGAAAEVEAAGEDYLEAMHAISDVVKLLRQLPENPSPEIVTAVGQELAEINRLLGQVKQTVAPILV